MSTSPSRLARAALLATMAVACGSRTGLVVSEGPADAATVTDAPPGTTADSGVPTTVQHACPYTTGVQAGAPWPMKGRCPDHDAHGDVLVAPANREAWSLKVGGAPGSPVIGADGTIYVSVGSNLVAVTARGSKRWTFTAPATLHDAPAIAADGTIYVTSGDAHGAALSAVNADGGARWSSSITSPYASVPMIGPGGNIYFNTESALRVFTPDGHEAATYPFPPNGLPSGEPTIGPDGTVYVTLTGQPNVLAVDPSGKTLRWTFDVKKNDPRYTVGPDMLVSAAVAPDGTVFVATGLHDGAQSTMTTVFALDTNGHVRWTRDFGAEYGDVCELPPAIGRDGAIVFVNVQGTLASFRPTGPLAWTFQSPDRTVSGLALGADGTVFAGGGELPALYAIGGSGTLVWSHALGAVPSGSPAIAANGGVIIPTGDGVLHAIGP